MSENVELVKRCFAAVRAWDVDTLLRIYDADVELMPRRAPSPGAASLWARCAGG